MPLRDDAPNRTSAYRAPLVWRVPEGPGTPVGQRSNTRNHAGPGCGAGGRWQGLEGCRDNALNRTSAYRAPLVWRVPEGRGCGAGGRWQGLAGLRDDAPSEARGADSSRAGRRPPACQAARPHSTAPRQGATVPGAPAALQAILRGAAARRHAKQPGPTARPHGKVRRCPERQRRCKQYCGRAAARRHAKQPSPTARCDGARSTRGTAHHRRQSARIPSQQRRQVDAPAARELGCLGAAREAVRQIHRVRLSIKRGQQRMRCDRD